ncbi:MAG: NAD(+)/NADH kinase, partial [Pseudomonadales bacterium]
MSDTRLAFVSSKSPQSQAARESLEKRYAHVPAEEADVIIALGGDGFMLETLHRSMHRSVPIYGMNRGTVGFLLNAYNEDDLPERIDNAARAILHPLAMTAVSDSGSE